MIQKDLFGNVISSPQDTHVNRFQSQGDKKEKKTLDTSIRTYLKLLHPKDPLGSFSKTLAVTSPWASTKCLLTWHLKTTPQGYLLFQLRPSALPTEEIDYGSSDEMWATPNTMDHLPPRSEESTKKMQEGHRKGRTRPSNLREQVDEDTMNMFPTPRASKGMNDTVESSLKRVDKVGYESKLEQAVAMWPTPSATPRGPHKGSIKGEVSENGKTRTSAKGIKFGATLETAVARAEERKAMFPTPRANEPGRTTKGYGRGLAELVEGKEQLLPTPSARDWKGGSGTIVEQEGKYYRISNTTGTKWGARLDAVADHQSKQSGKSGGQLNPTWVEWLMGYPKGWTELKD